MARSPTLQHNPHDRTTQIMFRFISLLLVCVVGLVAFVRITDQPLIAQAPRGPVLSERLLQITSSNRGDAKVLDALTGDVIVDHAAGHGVFISTIDRVVKHRRRLHRVAMDGPVHLRLREAGLMTVFDPITDIEIDLASFGKDNIAAFRALFEDRPSAIAASVGNTSKLSN
ncbi:MAG: photosynthetic complex assembly protein PuhC [Pseudomonadota bacterium]